MAGGDGGPERGGCAEGGGEVPGVRGEMGESAFGDLPLVLEVSLDLISVLPLLTVNFTA